MWSRFAKNSLRERAAVHFPLKCNCLIWTICQMAVKCVNHVPNSHTDLTFKGSYSGHCLPEVSFLIPLAPKASPPSSHYRNIRIRWCLIWWPFTYHLTSSLRSSRWTSQVTVACGERGIHSRKVLLFSVAYTTLSSVTSNSSGWRRDILKEWKWRRLQIIAKVKNFCYELDSLYGHLQYAYNVCKHLTSEP